MAWVEHVRGDLKPGHAPAGRTAWPGRYWIWFARRWVGRVGFAVARNTVNDWKHSGLTAYDWDSLLDTVFPLYENYGGVEFADHPSMSREEPNYYNGVELLRAGDASMTRYESTYDFSTCVRGLDRALVYLFPS